MTKSKLKEILGDDYIIEEKVLYTRTFCCWMKESLLYLDGGATLEQIQASIWVLEHQDRKAK